MTLHEFKNMNQMEKIRAIADYGKKLAEKEDDSFYYILYQLDTLFIEEKIEKIPGSSLDAPSHFSLLDNISKYVPSFLE